MKSILLGVFKLDICTYTGVNYLIFTGSSVGTGLGVGYLGTSVLISVVISLMITFSGSLFSKTFNLFFISAYCLARYSIANFRLSNE